MSHEQIPTPIEFVEQHYLPTEELAENEKAAREIFTLHRAQRYPQAGDFPVLFEVADIWPTSYPDTSENPLHYPLLKNFLLTLCKPKQ